MGNTSVKINWQITCQDHPHIHGEYSIAVGFSFVRRGSPPHTWGIRIPRACLVYPSRITPTYMGNTLWTQLSMHYIKDHPHIHGEYRTYVGALMPALGSPPHTWGIPSPVRRTLSVSRITPTYMGNTEDDVIVEARAEDHPHIHGEYRKAQLELHL